MTVKNSVTRNVALKSGNQCAYPECKQSIYDEVEEVYVGELAHIEAENPGGPRYNSNQSDSERNGVKNLMFMCEKHHKIIDNKEKLDEYTVKHLLNMKSEHESDIKEKLSSIVVDNIVKGAQDYLLESDVIIEISANLFEDWLQKQDYLEEDINNLIENISDSIENVGEMQNDTRSFIYNMVVHGNEKGSSLNKVIEKTKDINEDRIQKIVELLLEENILDDTKMYSIEEQCLDLENDIIYKIHNGNWTMKGSFKSLYIVWDFLSDLNIKREAKEKFKKIVFDQDVTPLN